MKDFRSVWPRALAGCLCLASILYAGQNGDIPKRPSPPDIVEKAYKAWNQGNNGKEKSDRDADEQERQRREAVGRGDPGAAAQHAAMRDAHIGQAAAFLAAAAAAAAGAAAARGQDDDNDWAQWNPPTPEPARLDDQRGENSPTPDDKNPSGWTPVMQALVALNASNDRPENGGDGRGIVGGVARRDVFDLPGGPDQSRVGGDGGLDRGAKLSGREAERLLGRLQEFGLGGTGGSRAPRDRLGRAPASGEPATQLRARGSTAAQSPWSRAARAVLHAVGIGRSAGDSRDGVEKPKHAASHRARRRSPASLLDLARCIARWGTFSPLCGDPGPVTAPKGVTS